MDNDTALFCPLQRDPNPDLLCPHFSSQGLGGPSSLHKGEVSGFYLPVSVRTGISMRIQHTVVLGTYFIIHANYR